MATGLAPGESGGVIDPVDVAGLGSQEWESVVAIPPTHPLVGGGDSGYNVEQNPWSRVVTTPYAQAGPSSDVIATPEGMATTMIAHPRDLLNFKGSWVPWVLLGLIFVVFFSHLRLRAGAGGSGFGHSFRAGAQLT